MNLAQLSENKIQESTDCVYIVFAGREITYAEMGRASKKLASALKNLGVKPGDRVLVQMPNRPEVFQSFEAIWRIGATVVPVNHMIGPEESSYIYQDCGGTTLISSTDFLPRIEACRVSTPGLRNIILTGPSVPDGYFPYQELVEKSPDHAGMAYVSDSDLAAIVYTAGTTGRPKGVMHSHQSLYYSGRISYETTSAPEGTVAVFVLPLCHIYGISCMVAGYFIRRLKAVVLSSFNVDKVFEAIQTYKGNMFTGVPTLYVYMLLHPNPKEYDLSSMKWWTSGSAALAPQTWHDFREKFGFEIINAWGMTETGTTGSCCPPDESKKVGSIGRASPRVQLKVVDSNGREVPQGQQGEIIVKTPAAMTGYWNRPQDTAEVVDDGWVRSGDIGYVDEDGFYFITDRKKDIIIKGGENISPREIEEVIMTHPAVSEAAVVGVKDKVYGEEIKAFVVAKPGMRVTSQELQDHCCASLKKFKTPKDFAFVDTLPKNLMGKVLRKELRRIARENQAG
ncbi:MAG: long-chain-fatty-acid--CoA ligase [Dehalococcoidia bacterium]|nr:long-chain-fatty-acid--CoA ligase [Dehalococcoidia bacterium]